MAATQEKRALTDREEIITTYQTRQFLLRIRGNDRIWAEVVRRAAEMDRQESQADGIVAAG